MPPSLPAAAPPPVVVAYLTPSVRLLGARQSLLQLVVGLDRARYTPVVFCPGPGGLADELAARGVAVEFLRLRPWRKGKSWPFIPFALASLRRRLAACGAALVHCNEPYPVPYAVRAAGGRPVVAHVRLEESPDFARKYGLPRADAVVCVSDAVRRSIQYWADGREEMPPLATPRGEPRVIYNGLDVEAFVGGIDVAAERATRRRLLGAGDEAIVLGQFGLLSARKNHATILRALRLLAERSPEFASRLMYVVIGDEGPSEPGERERVVGLARELGLRVREVAARDDAFAPLEWGPGGDGEGARPDAARAMPRVLFLPFRARIAPWYPALEAIVLPSTQEGFGRVIIEAAAFGVPAFGSDAGGITEVIAPGGGWVVPTLWRGAEAPDCWRRALLDAPLGHAEELRAAGEVARADVAARFSAAAHVRAVEALYDELLAPAPRARDSI